MYVPIPFYNADSPVGIGLWRIILTKQTTDVSNIISLFFPSTALQIGSTYSYGNLSVLIVNLAYDSYGDLVLDARISSTSSRSFPIFSDLIFTGLNGTGTIKSIIKLDENFWVILFVYGFVALALYELLK